MKHYLLKNTDGNVQIMTAFAREDGSYPVPDDEIKKWAPYKRAEVQSWREIAPEHLPKDRSFRNAWRDGGKTVDVDMPKARNIHRDRLREMRIPKFAALDIEMTRAFNNPSKQKEIEAQRQKLRDIPQDPSIEKASTPEELLAIMPDILK